MINKDPKNGDVLFPYLNGFDLNDHPLQQPSRWIINFHNWPIEKAREYKDCFDIVYKNVYQERQNNSDSRARDYWWLYMRPRPNMLKAIGSLDRVLIVAVTSKTLGFCFVPNNWIYDIATVVFALSEYSHFALLQSSFHEKWVWNYSSTLKQDLRYTPGTVFQSFPFPDSLQSLHKIGEKVYEYRKNVMLDNHEGLTAIYNLFHDEREHRKEIIKLRELQIELDNSVLNAYGWSKINLNHGFHNTTYGVRFTISEDSRVEILDRLLTLNLDLHKKELRLQDEVDLSLSKARCRSKKTSSKLNFSQPNMPMQIGLELALEPEPEHKLELEPRPAEALTIGQLERWSWYRCASCGSAVVGINAEDHINERHGNVDVGFLKPKTK